MALVQTNYPLKKLNSNAVKERATIPVVTTHIITDNDLGIVEDGKQQPVNFKRIVKLLTDPHSEMLFERHVHALIKMTKQFSKGFPMKDLVQLFKILNICADRVDANPVYEKPILEILKLCSLPFLMEKASDELVYEQIVVESISQLGYLMRIPSSEVRNQICSTLLSFTTIKSKQEFINLKPTNLKFNNKMIEISDISETLIKALALLETDLAVKLKVLEILQHFSKNSAKNCDQILHVDGGRRICSRLMDADPSGQLLFRSVDILWNLMDKGDTAVLASQLNNLICISQLRDAFVYEMTQGYSHYDRQLRNDLLVIATLVAYQCPQAPFVETGFAKQLTLFATFQEVKSHNVLVRHLKLQTNHEDFELRKLLINILVVLSKDRTVVSILSEGHLLLALFSFVRANDQKAEPRDWSPAQFEELQLHAMASLCTLCPLMLEDYMTCQGSTRLLLLLEWCVGPEEFSGQGNSFHGTGGRGTKKAQMRHCLRLLRAVVSVGDDNLLQDLTDQGAINQMIGVLNTAFNQRIEEHDAIEIEMQTDILFILSCLCEKDIHRKELFGIQGVELVIRYLHTDTRLLNSGLGHHKLLLASIDCTWCCIVGCFITEDYFLEKEGVFLLFDLLEVCPKSMHNVILGCLLDLCENPKTVNHILAWRGKTGCTAAHLLCQIWRHEENEIGVKRDNQGAIFDVRQPLMGAIQAEIGTKPLPASNVSPAIADVGENMRAKVYSIFCKTGFSDLLGLTVEDHVTITVIEKYLDFKMGEVWSETIQELQAENVRPVTPDQEALEAISRAIEERAMIVSTTQQELVEAQKNQDVLEEQEFYAEIRENQRQKEKAIADFTEFVARTSNFNSLKEAKQKQEISIDASRIHPTYNSNDLYHETGIPKLTTTVFSGKHVTALNSSFHTKPKLEGNQKPKFIKHITI
ncbi:cilia- and flagella-associated protein 69-like isoform X2 [Physella acuta]|uniref:cilia- and flagella-associated protein 69-like isoform X2 n=1 Tax=Physella acuta TaxID=109671 RepID=UPI0027DC9201|nr:cilia- and flagella-associated protein 69-like isoform X2 [Physella acuta]